MHIFRKHRTQSSQPAFCDGFFTGASAASLMDAWWATVTQHNTVSKSTHITVNHRSVPIPKCTANGHVRFSFEQLCGAALGPQDYLQIARQFHTVFVDDIPEMTMARRFAN